MGTRAWYEIYTVNQATGEVELAMEFRRSGDAFPGAALEELELLETLVCTLGGEFPVAPLEGLLERSVGPGRAHLPCTFATGCYVFLLLEAATDVARPGRLLNDLRPGIPAWRCAHFDQVLRQRIRRYGPITAPHPDPVVSRANRSIETAAHVHTWALSSTQRRCPNIASRTTNTKATCTLVGTRSRSSTRTSPRWATGVPPSVE